MLKIEYLCRIRAHGTLSLRMSRKQWTLQSEGLMHVGQIRNGRDLHKHFLEPSVDIEHVRRSADIWITV